MENVNSTGTKKVSTMK